MPNVYADRVRETTITTGTGTYNLAGPVPGFQSFVAGVATTNTCFYCVEDGIDWEIGQGTVTDAAPDTLSRDTILASSNADAAVDWGAGTKKVFAANPATEIAKNTGDMSDADVKTAYENNSDTNAFTDAEKTVVGNTSGGNSGDMSDAEVKTALENNANTNTITDAEATVLGNTSGSNSGDEPTATTSVEGVVERSTSAENVAGTDNTVYPTVLGVREIVGIAKQNSRSVDYTLVLADAGKSLYHSSGAGADTFTIPANSSVAYTIGTMITFVNDSGSGELTIAITDDVMRMSPDGETGSRTLAVDGIATAIKVTATKWMISGSGLT